MLALIDRRYGGVIPRRPQPDANGKTCWRLHQAIRRHGGNQRISRFLHATAETLIPYMIAIGAQTFANPEALRNMRRDCMTEHIFLEGRVQRGLGQGPLAPGPTAQFPTWTKPIGSESNRPRPEYDGASRTVCFIQR